jgi:hypothetical protein
MLALPLLVLAGCGTLGLSFMGFGEDEAPESDTADTAEPGPPPVDASLEGRTWEADLATASIPEPQGLSGLMALMDSTVVLFHIENHADYSLDLTFALTDASGQQDLCQPVLDFSGADFSQNPWLVVERTSIDLTINGETVQLRDAQLELQVATYGQGFTNGWIVTEVDGRELDIALGDRISSSVCEILDAMGTECHACSDGDESCFFIRIEDLEGNDYGGPFDPDVDASLCDQR